MASLSTATAVVPSPGGQLAHSSIRPAQPITQKSVQNGKLPAAPSPGRFQHPRLTEIIKRRSERDFTVQNVWTVIFNIAALLLSFSASGRVYACLDAVGVQARGSEIEKLLVPYSAWLLNLLRLILCSNLYFALKPVLPYVRKPDNLDDIALTPSQRALLGLPRSQSNTPASADSYITPPRYRRSSPSPFVGPPGSSSTNRATYSASPLSTSRYTVGFSPTPQQLSEKPSRRASGSPFSPSSPLFTKAFLNSTAKNDAAPNVDWTESTRSLLAGSTSIAPFQSSLRRSESLRERGRPDPGTPSPSAREKSKVHVQPGLNYKWLYEKGLKVGKNGQVEY